MKFAIYSDTHSGHTGSDAVHGDLVSAIQTWKPDMVVHGGDLKHLTEYDFDAFTAVSAPLMVPGKWLCLRGNHDQAGGSWAQYDALASQYAPGGQYYYTIPTEHVAFFMLDAWHPSEAPPTCTDYSAQVTWLQAMLQIHAAIPFKVALMHTPMYSSAAKGPNLCARQAFRQVLENAGVQLVVGFHRHNYERYCFGDTATSTTHVTSGGGACALIPHPPSSGSVDGRRAWSDVTHGLMLMTARVDAATVQMHLAAVDVGGAILDSVTWFAASMAPAQKPTKQITRI